MKTTSGQRWHWCVRCDKPVDGSDAAARSAAREHLEKLGENEDRIVMDIPPDREPRWRIGAPGTIRLAGEHVRIRPGERKF